MFSSYQEAHWRLQEEGEIKDRKTHEEDGKRVGYFGDVTKEDCENGYREKNHTKFYGHRCSQVPPSRSSYRTQF